MKPCVVGIGGAGGKILEQFLQSQDIDLVIHRFGDPIAFGGVKGVWLESAPEDIDNQSYYGDLTQGCYPPYLKCHEDVTGESPTRKYLNDTYGLDLKADGFDRRAEYLKALFELFELDFDPELKKKCLNEFKSFENPLSRCMYTIGIRPFTNIGMDKSDNSGNITSSNSCDSILFLASLGGGTGTGFINPITKFARLEDPRFFILALGILTERGPDPRGASEEQRLLGAVIAMYDLLTKESREGIDGLMLMDNQILIEKFNKNFSKINKYIFSALKPFLDQRHYPGDKDQGDPPALKRVFWEVEGEKTKDKDNTNKDTRLLPSIFVPCYHIQPDTEGDINTLVEGALGKDGRLFPCDPKKADRAFVFIRGFFTQEEIADAVASKTNLAYIMNEGKVDGKIKVYRKLGDSKNEDILILLRNPYGGGNEEYKLPGTLEQRLHEILSLSIKYIEMNRSNILDTQHYSKFTKQNLHNYFYGEGGLLKELYNCRDRLKEGDKKIFTKPLLIFSDNAMNSSALNIRPIKPEMQPGDTYEARIAELERMIGQLYAKNGFLKKPNFDVDGQEE